MTLKIESGIGKRPLWLKGPEASGRNHPLEGGAKSIGEVPPVIVDVHEYPDLLPLFLSYGSLHRKRRRLKLLSGKNARLVLAKNTVAAADHKGNVYLGVEFLREFGDEGDLITSVMAHEWGHLMSDLSRYGNVDHLGWPEIFKIRRDEEAAADCFCGRMLSMLGISPEHIVHFLKQAKNHSPTLKYYSADIRASIIVEAFEIQQKREDTAKKVFPKRSYHNPYISKVLQA